MDVVSPELNSLLPDEIMDMESIEDVAQSSQDVPVAMETDTTPESVGSSTERVGVAVSASGLPSPLVSLRPALDTSTATTKTTDSITGTTVTTSALQKLAVPLSISAANHQIILNKVASAQATEAARSAGGQKLLVTTIGKTGQPIVLQLPHSATKSGGAAGVADAKSIKLVTIGGRSDLKPVVGSTTGQVAALQGQQLKTVQIAKKTPVSSTAPIKFIINKPVNSKALSPQTSGAPVIAGRVLAQNSPTMPQRPITLTDSPHNTTISIQSIAGKKIAISPLKTPSKNIKPVQSVAVGGSQFKTIIPLAAQSNLQQIQVPGSRFHYVRLVTATTASGAIQSSAPSSSAVQTAKPMVVSTGAVRMSVPIVTAQTVKQVAPKPLTSGAQVVSGTPSQQRLIMPATALPQIQPNFANLPPGTVLAPAPGGGNVGYAVLPAQYVTQLQQAPIVTLANNSAFPTASAAVQTQRFQYNFLLEYCDCFANGEFCNNCNCNNCFNNLEHEAERSKAIKTCLDRNPEAFKPKIGKGKEGESDRRHSKGCNCKRSGCLKNYCECYEAKIMCSSICKCVGCKNFEESPERKTLMHLADAAEVRVQQQTAAKTKLSSQISDLLMRTTPVISSGGGRLPYTFVTKEVLEATCECLLEQAKRAEQTRQPQAEAERLILEEFGHCLMRIINSAGKAKADFAAINS
uniref:Lin-54 DREAM MuvB core complex component n=1 Tax=Hippocampus comes TaxID=109280 RepID=A0A3Q2XCP3_HIPCM